MIESTTNADNLFDLADIVTFVLAFAVVAVVLLASPRERRLVMGPTDVVGLVPHTPDEQERALAMTWPADGRMRG